MLDVRKTRLFNLNVALHFQAVTGGLTPAIRTQRTTTTPMTVQEISAVVSGQGQGQATIATTLTGTTQAVSMTPAQFAAQRMTTTIARGMIFIW